MSKKLITTELPGYAKAPEYRMAMRSTTLALIAIAPYGIGVWLFSAFGGIALYLALLVVVVLLLLSTYFAVLAMRTAALNERPGLVNGWAIAALVINFVHVALVSTGILMILVSFYASVD